MDEVNNDIEDDSTKKSIPDTDSAVSEQRVHERFRVSFKVLIRLSGGEIARAHAVDLSMGGIYIEYGASADNGKIFDMAFDLPFTDEFKRILVKARVVRTVVIGSRNVYGMAFVFTEFAKGTDEVLSKYLQLRGLKIS